MGPWVALAGPLWAAGKFTLLGTFVAKPFPGRERGLWLLLPSRLSFSARGCGPACHFVGRIASSALSPDAPRGGAPGGSRREPV